MGMPFRVVNPQSCNRPGGSLGSLTLGDDFSKGSSTGPSNIACQAGISPLPVRLSATSRDSVSQVVVRCDCGKTTVMHTSNILRNGCESCGCEKQAALRARSTTHGLAKTPIWSVWCGMRTRCYRGVTVCQEWRDSPESFITWAVQHGYQPGLEIDRIDNNGNYEPSNCRFVTKSKNCRNRRSNVVVDAFSESKTLIEWAEDSKCVVKYATLYRRVVLSGWPAELAITKGPRWNSLAKR